MTNDSPAASPCPCVRGSLQCEEFKSELFRRYVERKQAIESCGVCAAVVSGDTSNNAKGSSKTHKKKTSGVRAKRPARGDGKGENDSGGLLCTSCAAALCLTHAKDHF
jgi:hypothetical protein